MSIIYSSKKKKVEFVMGPNSIFYSHCSARTRPFESCCAAKYHLWNNPLVWYSIWIEILLRLISDTLSVLNTTKRTAVPRGPEPWGPGKKVDWPTCYAYHWNTVHREQMEYKVNRITAAFWKIQIYFFAELDEKTHITANDIFYVKCENGPLKG